MSAPATVTPTASCTAGPVPARRGPSEIDQPERDGATNLAREHDRVEPAAALAGAQQCLIRIESRPRARGYRSNDGGGGGAVRMVVLYDDGRPGLADLRAQ